MKWINHKLCNASMIYAMTGDLKATLFSTIGSIVPDALEIGGLIKHRTITHYPIVYIVPLVLILPDFKATFLMNAVFWCLVGCMLHVLLDALSKGGIPFFRPFSGKTLALNFYTTYHMSEFYLMGLICISCILLGRANGFLAMNHFTHQIITVLYDFKRMFRG
jgi:inner membrane protein